MYGTSGPQLVNHTIFGSNLKIARTVDLRAASFTMDYTSVDMQTEKFGLTKVWFCFATLSFGGKKKDL